MTHPSPFADRRPLYQIVAKELIAAIQRGEYPVGSELPSEALLCEQFRVSRNTVREAVRLIEQTGMVSRRQGVGTRVERDRVFQQYAQTLATISD
ncbi:MAG: winged helix-turn-helix domain-containing protein, partial [Rhodospirillales bacterium]|nr:winged helix-turn-helix domain-containing protein [Rhodospirillales bacterium]